MSRPPHLCTCGKIVAHDSRCECQQISDRARKARFDSTRPSARARGYNREWDIARREYLSQRPYCRMCGKAANLVDHVIPHKGDKRLFWDRTNWQPLCKRCHDRHKQRIERNTQ